MFYLTQTINSLVSTSRSNLLVPSRGEILKLFLMFGSMFIALDAFAQAVDISGALDDTKEAAFEVMDWAFIIVIATVFLIGAVGISFALVKVFSGKASEGVTALIVGIICIVLAASLIAVFYTYYQTAVS